MPHQFCPSEAWGDGRGPPRCGPPTPPQLGGSSSWCPASLWSLKAIPPAWGPPSRCRPHPPPPARKAGSLTSPHQPHALLSARALATMARGHFQSLFPLRSSLWDALAPDFSVGHSLPLAPPPQNVPPPQPGCRMSVCDGTPDGTAGLTWLLRFQPSCSKVWG